MDNLFVGAIIICFVVVVLYLIWDISGDIAKWFDTYKLYSLRHRPPQEQELLRQIMIIDEHLVRWEKERKYRKNHGQTFLSDKLQDDITRARIERDTLYEDLSLAKQGGQKEGNWPEMD